MYLFYFQLRLKLMEKKEELEKKNFFNSKEIMKWFGRGGGGGKGKDLRRMITNEDNDEMMMFNPSVLDDDLENDDEEENKININYKGYSNNSVDKNYVLSKINTYLANIQNMILEITPNNANAESESNNTEAPVMNGEAGLNILYMLYVYVFI
jgi:hypothetical protein